MCHHMPPWEPPQALTTQCPQNSPTAGARVPATASRRRSAQVVPCWIRHLHGNPPAQAVRARKMPSPRKRGWAGRDVPAGHRLPTAGGLGVPRASLVAERWKGDDSPPRPNGTRGAGDRAQPPISLAWAQEGQETGGSSPVPKMPTQSLPPLPHPRCTGGFVWLTYFPDPGLSLIHSSVGISYAIGPRDI